MWIVQKKSLAGKRFIVTAGPTVEAIDPVRYISNHSTGKMGYAIAEELSSRGAEVTLITGPTNLTVNQVIKRIDVTSAEQMYEASLAQFEHADGAVMCAAVADYTPSKTYDTKLKKKAGELTLELKPTKDIAAELGRIKGKRLLVGFALETDKEEQNAKSKLERKGFDFIVLNSLRDKGAGFATDTNRITIIDKKGDVNPYPLASKTEVASIIADKIDQMLC